MKITQHIFSIPPHLSTTWDQISAIYVKEGTFTVSLKNGTVISIPDLPQADVETIFAFHVAQAEMQQKRNQHLLEHGNTPPFLLHQTPETQQQSQGSTTLRFNFDNIEALGNSMQHTPAMANTPNLPDAILNKISEIVKIIAPGEMQNIPQPEPHCNCPHCQIARAILGKTKEIHPAEQNKTSIPHEEDVLDEDLSFQEWEIEQTGDKLYTVTNKLDKNEKYNVFLGEPVGCTCGHAGCEHVLAVLKS
ncbi:MAG: hypothetical protein WCG42_04960 [Parachlamydiaceae bacterium]